MDSTAQPKPKTNLVLTKRDIIVIILGLLILTAAILYAGDRLLNRQAPPKQVPIATPSASSTYCSTGQVYENKKQGYKLCLSAGQTASESASQKNGGLIQIRLASPSATLRITTRFEGASGGVEFDGTNIKDQTIKVDSITANKKTFTLKAKPTSRNELISFTNFKRFYEIALETQQEIFDPTATVVDRLIQTWRFIPATPDPPWSDSGNILVESPWPGDTIANPFTISGQAAAFEGVVSIRIRDEAGNILTNETVTTISGMEMSGFSKTIDYSKPTTQTGTVELFTISPKDGSQQDQVSIPINFKNGL